MKKCFSSSVIMDLSGLAETQEKMLHTNHQGLEEMKKKS